jgi:uncharacterized repeat protein (TIGR04138 family)
MTELAFAEGILDRIRARGGTYDERAYLFLLAGIEYIQTRLEVRRHITGQELAWACRDFALKQFGVIARDVLACWGVTRTQDFGRIVYTLVDSGLLVTQPGDSEADFADVFDFAEAFDEAYEWRHVPVTPGEWDVRLKG